MIRSTQDTALGTDAHAHVHGCATSAGKDDLGSYHPQAGQLEKAWSKKKGRIIREIYFRLVTQLTTTRIWFISKHCAGTIEAD